MAFCCFKTMKSTCNSKGQISKIGKIAYRNVAKDFFSLQKLGSIHYIIMSTRLLFLPFLIALAGFVSCDEIQPEAAVGCVTVDKEQFCALTSVIGSETEGNHKWAFYDDGKARVNVTGYKCRCDDAGHIPFTLTFIDIDLPSIATMQIPLEERTEGENY